MSAATSAEVVGICSSPAIDDDEDEDEALTVTPAIMAADTGAPVTRVTPEVEVLCGESFCCTATRDKAVLDSFCVLGISKICKWESH